MKIKNTFLLLSLIVSSLIVIQMYSTPRAKAEYKSGVLMSDGLFLDAQSMNATEIQNWLTNLNSGLAKLSFVIDCDLAGAQAKQIYLSLGAPCGHTAPASHIIYYASQVYGINPRVILATMQKEQSLTTASNPTSWQLSQAMGYACPTSGSCSSSSNFFYQIDNGTWVLRFHFERARGNNNWWYASSSWVCGSSHPTYYTPNLYPGQTVTFHDPYTGGTSYANIYVQNAATSALYCYTPHAFNNHTNSPDPEQVSGSQRCWSWLPAAGSVGRCYTGSYNFVYWYEKWWGSTTHSILFRVNGSTTWYLEWGEFYYPIPSSTMLERYGLGGIAPRLVNSIPDYLSPGNILSTSAKFGSDNTNSPDYTATVNLVEGGKIHPAPNWSTLGRYGISNYMLYDSSLQNLLKVGGGLRPLAREPNGAIYYINSSKKHGFPDWNTFSTLSGPDYAGNTTIYSKQSVTNMSSDFLTSISTGAPMLLDGSIIRGSSGTIYLFDAGKKYGFSASIYSAWGGGQDHSFSQSLVNLIPSGSNVSNLISSADGKRYLVDKGEKRLFSATSQTSWGLEDAMFSQTFSDRALANLHSANITNLITSGAGVYYVYGGNKHGVSSLGDFNNAGFSWNNVDAVSSSTLSLLPSGAAFFAPGSLLRNPQGTVYLVGSDFKVYGIPSLSVFNNFGFVWKNVRNLPRERIAEYNEAGILRTLVRSESTDKYYLVDNGAKHLVDSAAFSNTQYNMTGWQLSNMSEFTLSKISTGKQLTRFIRGSGPTVYYIENGKKRGITSSSKFYDLGGTWNDVIDVSEALLELIPRGSII